LPDPFRNVPTEALLQRVADARESGDWTAARGEWEACIARARERVVNVVDRYVAKGWIPRADHEDVVQEALIRGARSLVVNLRSLSADAFFAAMVRCADFQCRDVGRKVMRREQHERAADPPEDWRPGDAGWSWQREQDLRETGALLDDLIAQLPDVRAQKLLVLQRLGVGDAEIAGQLGISIANVHTIRSRALKHLRGLMDR
jgi:RNA polymerase sigma factor (sigma-70 family)